MWKGSPSSGRDGQKEPRRRPLRELVSDEMRNARMQTRRAHSERWERPAEESSIASTPKRPGQAPA